MKICNTNNCQEAMASNLSVHSLVPLCTCHSNSILFAPSKAEGSVLLCTHVLVEAGLHNLMFAKSTQERAA